MKDFRGVAILAGVLFLAGVPAPVFGRSTQESGEERRILLMKQDLDRDIAKNQKLLDEIRAKLSRYEEMKKKDFVALIAIYESMAPRTAALQIDAMAKNLRLMLISGMNPRKASRIMRYVDPQVAVEISAQMAGQPQSPGGRQ